MCRVCCILMLVVLYLSVLECVLLVPSASKLLGAVEFNMVELSVLYFGVEESDEL